jgi:hypothetical protein
MRSITLLVVLAFTSSCVKHPAPNFAAKQYPMPEVSQEPEPTLLPEKARRWCEAPKVHICDTSPFALDEVEATYSFFGQEVAEFTDVECNCDPEEGVIKFGVEGCFPGKRDSHHGVTRMLFTGECMNAAIVQVNTDEPLVVMHEAAHSIGWMHSYLPGHMMNPYYELAGWETVGME